MLRRVPLTTVETLDQVYAQAEATDTPLVLIFDADNTLVRQGCPPAEFTEKVNAVIDRFEALPHVERVIVLSNGPPRGVERMIDRGNKPWTTRRRLGLANPDLGIWVIGDQILTDGLVAWRLADRFFHLAIAESGEHPRQAFMRASGRTVGRFFFRKADSARV